MPNKPTDRLTWSADADDLRVDHIVAQLEEAQEQRLTDDWLEEQEHPDADAWHGDDKGGGHQ
jgi:hypothetical protein